MIHLGELLDLAFISQPREEVVVEVHQVKLVRVSPLNQVYSVPTKPHLLHFLSENLVQVTALLGVHMVRLQLGFQKLERINQGTVLEGIHVDGVVVL